MGARLGRLGPITVGVRRPESNALVWGPAVDLDDLLRSLREYGIQPRVPDAAEFARRNQVLLLRHETSETPIDLSLAWLPFEHEALTRAEAADFHGVEIPIATPEDLVIQKAVAFRFRDRDDIERLLVLHGQTMDLERVRRVVAEFAAILEYPNASRTSTT